MSYAPLVPDPVDMETQLMAEATVKNTLSRGGDPVLLFLGRNSKDGLNVFAFDGSNVTAVGDPISKELRENVNWASIDNSFAEVDP